jgi:hypothetical protein
MRRQCDRGGVGGRVRPADPGRVPGSDQREPERADRGRLGLVGLDRDRDDPGLDVGFVVAAEHGRQRPGDERDPNSGCEAPEKAAIDARRWPRQLLGQLVPDPIGGGGEGAGRTHGANLLVARPGGAEAITEPPHMSRTCHILPVRYPG